MLFSAFERTDREPSRHTESNFQFLDRCKSAAVDKVRNEIENWFSHYPAAERDELKSRFRDDFQSPFFELLLHELFMRQGFAITVHPDVGTRGKRPDFEVRARDSAESVIVEATLCLGEVGADSTSARMKPVYDAINSLNCAFCFLGIREITLKSSNYQPPVARIKSFLKDKLDNLDAEAILATAADVRDFVRLRFEDKSVVIEFEVLPKKREAWGRTGSRLIGVDSTLGRWGDGTDALNRSLDSKATYYGEIGKPFVIAVNTLSRFGSDEAEWFAALFGTDQSYVNESTGELCVRQIRDGVWGHATSPRCTRVSAAIFGFASPFNVPRIQFLLIRNPWAAHPLPATFWKLPEVAIVAAAHVRKNENTGVGDILRLAADWPGDLFSEWRQSNEPGFPWGAAAHTEPARAEKGSDTSTPDSDLRG